MADPTWNLERLAEIQRRVHAENARPCGHYDFLSNCWHCNEDIRPFIQERRAEENRSAMERGKPRSHGYFYNPPTGFEIERDELGRAVRLRIGNVG